MATTVKVTSKGREVMVGRMQGSSPTQAEPLNVGWGIGGLGTGSPYTATVNDVAPFDEASESRVAGTSSTQTTTSTNDTYQVVGTITCSGSGKTIAEAFLSDSSSKPTSNTVAASGVVGSNSSTTLNTGSTFTPGNNTYCQIDTEVMKITAGSGSTSLTVVRAQNGTSAISTISVSDIVTTGNPPGTATSNGTLFVHASFTGLALNVNDSIQFTFQVQVSSS